MTDQTKKCAVILLAEDDPGDQKLTKKPLMMEKSIMIST